MTDTLALQPEKSLLVTCSPGALAVINRIASAIPTDRFLSMLDTINVNYGCSVQIGPFSTLRYYKISTSNNVTWQTNDEKLTNNHNSTGLYTGGVLSINSSTKFNISAGSGVVIDNYTDINNPIAVKVTWPAFTGVTSQYLSSYFVSYVAIDAGGNIVQFAGSVSADSRRDYIILGLLIHTGQTVLEDVSSSAAAGYDQANGLNDLAAALGIINLTGNIFSANGANLKINKSVGMSFKLGSNIQRSAKSPNDTTSNSLTAPLLFKPFRNGSGGYSIVMPLTDSVDPANYDNGTGTLATVAASDPWQVIRIYLDPVNNDVIAHYGQAVYKTAQDAEYAIPGEVFSPNPVLVNASLRCFLIIKRDCTSLQDSTKCKFIAVNKLGESPAQGSTANVPVASGTTANRFESAQVGQMYFDTTLGIPIWFNGTSWVNYLGVVV